jgi:hypothetical protein
MGFFQKLQYLFEDNGKTAMVYANNGVPVVLFNNPWNIAYEHPLIFRVGSWEQALDVVRKKTTQSPMHIANYQSELS